ncbi:hypothetical protein L0F81_17270 [Streptomyces tricolor]|uniref:Uncharacterized protein n=1 Tax=Streptomyces tricolor TaxID=68277 RepID=A0ABS9JHI9_9ACTN|nr:hypothetical protein [Streptomyces tricolor]MCG0065025.1 hypothetical protein [Streptomyces tricolor]
MCSNVPMVRAGDTLILCFEKPQRDDDLKRIADEVMAVLPGVKVAVVEGVSGVAVYRADDQSPDANM